MAVPSPTRCDGATAWRVGWERVRVGRDNEGAYANRSSEPTPDPSQEGNCSRVPAVLLPSWEGLGVGWFMERVRVRTL